MFDRCTICSFSNFMQEFLPGRAWRNMEMESDMSKREIVAAEIGRLSEQDLDRLLAYIRALSDEHAERSLPCLAAESALAKDWLTPEEDEAWAHL
jgi:hypothetical protein